MCYMRRVWKIVRYYIYVECIKMCFFLLYSCLKIVWLNCVKLVLIIRCNVRMLEMIFSICVWVNYFIWISVRWILEINVFNIMFLLLLDLDFFFFYWILIINWEIFLLFFYRFLIYWYDMGYLKVFIIFI